MADTFLNIGDKAPDFMLKDPKDNDRNLASYGDGWKIIYFYPKDNTSGCTTEAIDFSDKLSEIRKLNADVVGISPDTVTKHNNFIDKHSLKVNLLSDPETNMISDYGVWQQKKMCGREYMGVVRTTYLIDSDGIIKFVWKNVKVKGHAEAVLEKLKELKND